MIVIIEKGLYSPERRISFEIEKFHEVKKYTTIHPTMFEMIYKNVIFSDQIKVLNNIHYIKSDDMKIPSQLY